MMPRSLIVPGSLSSALHTMYLGKPGALRTSSHLLDVGNPAPPMPRRPAAFRLEMISRALRVSSKRRTTAYWGRP